MKKKLRKLLKTKKPFRFGKASHWSISRLLDVFLHRNTTSLKIHSCENFCGLDETRTRDPLRDRQVF